jgi:hypothetical protein
MRIRGRGRRARRAVGAPVVTNPAAEHRIRLIGLLETVTRAIELQPAAEEVIAACAQPGDTPASVARRGSRIASEFCRLHGWAADLSRSDGLDSVQVRAAQLINYHAAMLDLCLKLAFPNVRTPTLESRRLRLDGLGEPACTLRETRVVLLMWINDLDDTAG